MDLTSKESEVSSSGLEVRKQEAEADGEACGEKEEGGEAEGEVKVSGGSGPLDCSLSPPALSPDNLHESAAKVIISQQYNILLSELLLAAVYERQVGQVHPLVPAVGEQ